MGRGGGSTFGGWFKLLEETTQQIDERQGPLYRSIRRLLGTEEDRSPFHKNIRWLLDHRNELGHDELPVGSRADNLIRDARERLEQCIVEATPIWRHPLRLVLNYDALRNNKHMVATCLDYSGDRLLGRRVEEKYKGTPPKKQDLYLLQDGRKWIPLYPFISVHYCPACGARETYFIHNWAKAQEEAGLKSFERAHKETSQEIGQFLTSWLYRP